MNTEKNSPSSIDQLHRAAVMLLPLIVFIVFSGALENGFVEWDDPEYVSDNPKVRTLNLSSLWWMLTTYTTGNWHPVTWLSHALDWQLFGANPAGHHATSILLHSLNSVCIYLLFVGLIRRVDLGWAKGFPVLLGGMLCALLFGIHPLRVESAVWVSERKDVLSAFFMLTALLAYLKYTQEKNSGPRRKWYASMFVLFVLSLMSKPMTVTFPVILLALDAFPLDRIRKFKDLYSAVWEKVPLFLMSLLCGILTLVSQKQVGAMVPVENLSGFTRLLNSINSAMFYLQKTLLPLELSPLYPFPKNISLDNLSILTALAGFAVITGWSVWKWTRGKRLWLTCWGYYLITVAPVIGLVQVGRQGAADRYTYLPTLSFYFLAGLGAVWLWQRISTKPLAAVFKSAFILCIAILLVSLSAITHNQVAVWKNSKTLWQRAADIYPGRLPVAHHNLGRYYKTQGQQKRATEEFNLALKINPSYVNSINDLGLLSLENGQLQQAEAYFRAGLKIAPDAVLHTNMGLLYHKRGVFKTAEDHYLEALKLDPDNEDALNNLGLVYNRMNLWDKAVSVYKMAIDADPYNVSPHVNLGILYKKMGLIEQAVGELETAVGLLPGHPDIHNALGETLMMAGNRKRAEEEFNIALSIHPEHARAKANLKSLEPGTADALNSKSKEKNDG